MILHGSNARRFARRLDDERLATMQCPAGQCACDDRADAAQRENAVNRKPRLADVAWRWRVAEDANQRRFQLLETTGIENGGRDNRRLGER